MDVFVKILGPDSDEVRAAEALRHFGDRAAVKVLGSLPGAYPPRHTTRQRC
jgi:hypothetical protein